MSYILEALRKAEAERERGTVPDLHAQPLPPGAAESLAEPPRASLLPWLAAGALLAIVAGAGWFVIGRGAPAPVAVAVRAPSVAASVGAEVPTANAANAASSASAGSAAASAASAAPASASVASALAPAAAVAAGVARAASAAQTPEAAPAAPPKPAGRAVPPRRPPAVAPERVARAQRAPRATPAKAAAAPPPRAEAAATRVPALGELPGALRQQVPPLAIGGSVYSPQASARMVIVNGQVFQEGSRLAPELKLEQIRPKTAVFSIQGQLFEMPL